MLRSGSLGWPSEGLGFHRVIEKEGCVGRRLAYIMWTLSDRRDSWHSPPSHPLIDAFSPVALHYSFVVI